MIDNEQNSINEINFTKRCILMAVISKDKNLVLINSFHKIPIVKLYTADSSYENFIYSKIKGAFCLLMTKEKEAKYYFRIYSLKDYSLLFNMEIKKQYMQYITQYHEDFYFMELRQSFLGFKFLSKESASIFFLLLNEDPKKEVIEQNEGAMNIKHKDISKTIGKVTDYIKTRLKYKFENYGSSKNLTKTSYSNKRRDNTNSQNKENFNTLYINDIKGEYIDTSIIPDVETLINNLEIDDKDSSCYLFTEKKLNYEKCKQIVNKYQINSDDNNNLRRRNESNNIPLTIIDKDCHTIANPDLYVEIMTKNMINNIRTQKRLEIFQKEHKKRHKGLSTGSNYKYGRKTRGKTKIGRTSNLSSLGQNRITTSNYNSERETKNSNYLDISNNSSNSSQNKTGAKSTDKDNSDLLNKEDNDDKNEKLKKIIDKKIKNVNINKGVDAIEEKPEDEEKEYKKGNKIMRANNIRQILEKK